MVTGARRRCTQSRQDAPGEAEKGHGGGDAPAEQSRGSSQSPQHWLVAPLPTLCAKTRRPLLPLLGLAVRPVRNTQGRVHVGGGVKKECVSKWVKMGGWKMAWSTSIATFNLLACTFHSTHTHNTHYTLRQRYQIQRQAT